MFNKTEILFLKSFAQKDSEDKFSVYSSGEINGLLDTESDFEQLKDMLKDLQAKGVLVLKYAVNDEFCFSFTRQAFIELEHIEATEKETNMFGKSSKPLILRKNGKPLTKNIKWIFYGAGALVILVIGFLSGLLGGYVASLI